MKCKIFIGKWYEAQDAFNAWAKGKALTREVLIHTIPLSKEPALIDSWIAIVVYHPEDPQWDKTEPEHTSEDMVKQHIEGIKSTIEVAQ
jgi:hypothetical protein